MIRAITPNNDTTHIWYRGDGLVDSTRQPGHPSSSRLVYNATWKNVSQAIDPTGEVLTSNAFDAYGRTTTADRKVEVQVSGSAFTYQWQPVQSYFNVANQTDSTVVFRTANCAAPCSTPAWPPASDTLRTQRVGVRFDRNGRDSLRINDRGIRTMYLYDRLDRLVSRRPWTDSMAVKDSTAYDAAGNVKKTITRNHTITTNYDSRNRDTLTVIPGIGTLRKSYGGPQNQLTRQWHDSPIDSIGGINGELRWGYDARGRLRADTSYIGTAAQATTYSYDQWERVRTMTDPVGTWTTGYETLRGYTDTLITPLGDTLTYVHDEQGRAVGPYIRSGGLRHWSELEWNLNESLDSVGTMTQGVGSAFVSGRYVRPNPVDDGYVALAPVWVEQRGVGAPIDSLQDVVAYDGWERLTSWTALKNGVAIAGETYQFDRAGNISQSTGAATYDAITDRLMSRVEVGGNRLFAYDRAGNLIQQTKLSTGEVRAFDYDALNRLVTLRKDGVLMARYAYDVLGRRIAKRVYSNASDGTPAYTRFIYHGDEVAFQADSAGSMGLKFTLGLGTDDLRAVQDGAGQNYYIVQDKLGSVRGLFERNGTWRAGVRFNPYGDLVAIDSTGPKPPIWYAWTGREFDEETGWFYHRARHYSPLVRRFVQEDPIGYDGGVNLYAYVEGQALEATDPTGTESSLELVSRGGLRWRRPAVDVRPRPWVSHTGSCIPHASPRQRLDVVHHTTASVQWREQLLVDPAEGWRRNWWYCLSGREVRATSSFQVFQSAKTQAEAFQTNKGGPRDNQFRSESRGRLGSPFPGHDRQDKTAGSNRSENRQTHQAHGRYRSSVDEVQQVVNQKRVYREDGKSSWLVCCSILSARTPFASEARTVHLLAVPTELVSSEHHQCEQGTSNEVAHVRNSPTDWARILLLYSQPGFPNPVVASRFRLPPSRAP